MVYLRNIPAAARARPSPPCRYRHLYMYTYIHSYKHKHAVKSYYNSPSSPVYKGNKTWAQDEEKSQSWAIRLYTAFAELQLTHLSQVWDHSVLHLVKLAYLYITEYFHSECVHTREERKIVCVYIYMRERELRSVCLSYYMGPNDPKGDLDGGGMEPVLGLNSQ